MTDHPEHYFGARSHLIMHLFLSFGKAIDTGKFLNGEETDVESLCKEAEVFAHAAVVIAAEMPDATIDDMIKAVRPIEDQDDKVYLIMKTAYAQLDATIEEQKPN